jgi:methylated-DNA-[protein]-cysteine S-methyltransferase
MQFSPATMQTSWASPLGPMIVAASPAGLVGLWFSDQKHLPDSTAWPVMRQASAATGAQHALAQKACSQLGEYFAGDRKHFDLALDLSAGTPFQQAVWRGLLGIPQGHTTSYGALAAQIGRPAAVRALGAAVGHNPISIIVPCHRVLGADGSLTGYAGGLPRKTALLQLEGVLQGALA